MSKHIKSIILITLIFFLGITSVSAASQEDTYCNAILSSKEYKEFNQEIFDLYNIQRSKYEFDINNPETYVFQPAKVFGGKKL